MVVSTSPQCKLLHNTLMNNEVQRSKSFHTAVVLYYSVVGHSPSLIIYSCYYSVDVFGTSVCLILVAVTSQYLATKR